MAEEDIYGSKKKYDKFKNNLHSLLICPPPGGKQKYYCRNPDNLKYFEKLFVQFESKDLSYIRRTRVLHTMKFIVYSTTKDLIQQFWLNGHSTSDEQILSENKCKLDGF